MSVMKILKSLSVVALIPAMIFAQGSIQGTVTDVGNGNELVGANVILEGTSLGAATINDGSFNINKVDAGTYNLTVRYIGYKGYSESVSVINGATVTVNVKLERGALELNALEVLASRATIETPVAYTNIDKTEMEARLGSQDIPMVLNTTPSVYATQQGGGAGDARINVRGFNQRNVAVMINGVPQNDMENGWVYWSNWDGVGDATSSIQMQRGLSAVNLATPSIGGTMNIITDPTALTRGGSFKQEMGGGSFLKSTVNYNTGLIADKFAFSTSIVRKTGEGVIDKTWTDAWAYYFGASYALNSGNRFELYAVGAPQRHGQNLYKQNVMAYDKEFAAEIMDKDAMDAVDSDYDENGDDPWQSDWEEYEGKFQEVGHLFNQNWAPVSESYTGQQYFYMYGDKTVDRHDANYLNERENFFHKPLVNLNHFLKINEKMRLSSVLYWSGGSGGGTGTYGKIPTMDAEGNLGDDGYKFYYGDGPWTRDWDTLIDYNSGSEDTVYVDKSALVRTHGDGNNQSVGILRNSINRQSTLGLISKFNYNVSEALEVQIGIDWRTAAIEHAREVRDLMGGDYYLDFADKNFADGKKVGLGDIIAYHNETTVDWIGGFAQGNLDLGAISAYGMAGVSSIGYSYQDHFSVADELITSDPILAMQFKGGGMFHVDENIAIFVNSGYVEKAPIMDNVIYLDGTVASNPSNEKFISSEAGLNYGSSKFAVKANVYNTSWLNRNLTKSVTTGQGSSGDTDVIFLTGVNQNHAGFELEIDYQLISMLGLNATVSIGNWKFTDDASGRLVYDMFDSTGVVTGQGSLDYNYALKDLYVGDMPQTSYVFGATVTPIKGLRVQGLMSIYDNNYADWGPDSRSYSGDDADADRDQVWKAPSYSKVDLHISYKLPKIAGLESVVYAHVFNALDATYIQDAVDHSSYNGFSIYDTDGVNVNAHSASRAEVFLGAPRYINMGLKINF